MVPSRGRAWLTPGTAILGDAAVSNHASGCSSLIRTAGTWRSVPQELTSQLVPSIGSWRYCFLLVFVFAPIWRR